MDANCIDTTVSGIAAAIADPARSRMLYCLMDGHARSSTELAMVAGISPSTASVHLARLKTQRLVNVVNQGRYRYYSLQSPTIAAALEALTVVAGDSPAKFVPNTPRRLRAARTCYDHMAGSLAVALHDRLLALNWLSASTAGNGAYEVTAEGAQALEELGLDLGATRALRRRFAYACLDWSERRPHIAGAVGAGILQIALRRNWVVRDLDSRVLALTQTGRREIGRHLGIQL